MLIRETMVLEDNFTFHETKCKNNKLLTLNSHVSERVQTWENLVLDELKNKMNKF